MTGGFNDPEECPPSDQSLQLLLPDGSVKPVDCWILATGRMEQLLSGQIESVYVNNLISFYKRLKPSSSKAAKSQQL